MPEVWIENRHNLHCPTCDQRLVERAGRHQPMGRPDPLYVTDGRSLACPAQHSLPEQAELYAYRDECGYPPEAPSREVPRPH